MKKNKLPTVVIVGRINVGKSTLFNRLTETSKALVSKIEGTTRDYNFSTVSWRKKTFALIDTGGVNIGILKHSIQSLLAGKKDKSPKADEIEKEIVAQTKEALKKADVILMVADGQAGLLPEDKELALVLKKLKTPIMLVCNKIDSQKYWPQVNDFFKLGLGTPLPLSAANGSGTGDFLDELVKKIKGTPGRPRKTEEKPGIKVAIIGKPNAGKSSLVNKILGEKRVIVTPIPQTTREPQDTDITYKKQKITLIDTAGLRKQGKIKPGLEKMATKRTLAMLNSADIVLLVTEVNEPLARQDSHLAGLIKDAGAGIIMITNKWDLIEDKDERTDSQIKKQYQAHFPFLSFVPIIFTSAKTGKNVDKILDLILEVEAEKQKEIPQEKLEEIMKKLIRHHRPTQAKGPKRPRVYGLTQTNVNPPEFTVVIGSDQSIQPSYLRFIENQLRHNFGFLGVAVKIKVRTKQ